MLVHVIGFLDSASDTDDFDDSVILHEFGHYLQAVFSHNSSPGGAHYGCSASPAQNLDYRLAFGEGWGNSFAQMVQGNSTYVDTSPAGGFSFDVETPCLSVNGPGSEEAIGAVFWDLFDGALGGVGSADSDSLGLGFGPIWQAIKDLRNVSHVWTADLLVALLGRGYVTLAEWNGNFASFGVGTPLPAFPPFFIDTNTLYTDLVEASLGQESLLAANRYYELTINGTGTLTLTLTIGDATTNDLDLILWENPDPAHPPGEFLGIAISPTASVETITIDNLLPGVYMVQVRAAGTPIGAPTASFTIQANFP